jgi:hypothetical protein
MAASRGLIYTLLQVASLFPLSPARASSLPRLVCPDERIKYLGYARSTAVRAVYCLHLAAWACWEQSTGICRTKFNTKIVYTLATARSSGEVCIMRSAREDYVVYMAMPCVKSAVRYKAAATSRRCSLLDFFESKLFTCSRVSGEEQELIGWQVL